MILAKYTGIDDMGLKHGKVYKIRTYTAISGNSASLNIYVVGSKLKCSYHNLESFLKFWRIVAVHRG